MISQTSGLRQFTRGITQALRITPALFVGLVAATATAQGSARTVLGPASGQRTTAPSSSGAQAQGSSTSSVESRRLNDGRWIAVDTNGTALTRPWRPGWSSSLPGLSLSAEWIAVKDGFTIIYTARNDGSSNSILPPLSIPDLRVGSSQQAFDFTGSGWSESLTLERPRIQGCYPWDLYSPVAVVRGSQWNVGVSLIYPILEYRHDASIAVRRAGQEFGAIEVHFGGNTPAGDAWLGNTARLAPGETKIYRLAVRFTPRSTSWKETLEPYRKHFERTYGGVRYQRDGRPIRGLALAAPFRQSESNPEGWAPIAGRPLEDDYGQYLRSVEETASSAPRLMLWAPTGLSPNHKSTNYPFQFASRWEDDDPHHNRSTPVSHRLAQVVSSKNITFGLWWGHALEPTLGFDKGAPVRFDRTSQSMKAAAFRELDIAVASGAREVGLDAFSHRVVPLWDIVPWLEEMRNRYPQLKFCTEGRSSDILHRLAPTYLDSWSLSTPTRPSHERIRGRFHLADLLLPGHETWAGMCFERSGDASLWGAHELRSRQLDRINWTSMKGFVPVVFLNADMTLITTASQDGPDE